MATTEDLLGAIDDVISAGARRGMLHQRAEDERLDGRTITLSGQRLVNFGSCSYLGLETHPVLKAAVCDAVDRFGTQFSSSRAYLSAPAYARAEADLGALFSRPTILAPTTTLGHLATVPTLVGASDAFLMDHQLHQSVQVAARIAQAQGALIEVLPHSDMNVLEQRLQELSKTRRRVWYAADGLFSMYADFVPVEALEALMTRYDNLWLYLDDAHSASWTGRHGRGFVLEHFSPSALSRSVVALSMNKSFAAAGGALTFPDQETRRRVFTVGGPLIFSGPIQPPMLGAVIASVALHRTDEVADRQARLLERIRLFNRLAKEQDLPLVSNSEAPIRCVGAGTPDIAYALVARLKTAGFFVDTATFPAVAAKRSGARIALTAHHSEQDIYELVGAISEALPEVLAEGGSSQAELEQVFVRQLAQRDGRSRPHRLTAPPIASDRDPSSTLRLERHDSIATVDRAEWDAALGGRGTFDWQALHTIEEVFARREGLDTTDTTDAREHEWTFHYWLVRDDADQGHVVGATFFTTALWKDDMLASAAVSREVERRRTDEPYYLTSTMLAMGSLLSEGDHLYLDRSRDWRNALRLILRAARVEEDHVEAAAVVLRDLPDDDQEMHDVLISEGFIRIPVYDTWVREMDFDDDSGFLAGLTRKARYHQRVNVLAWEQHFDVEVVTCGANASERMTSDELDHLHDLYVGVHARNHELNVYPLPRRVLDAVLGHAGWELVMLRLRGGPEQPVAFAAQHVGAEHVAPLFVGLDYAYVASHHTYQQLLWQAIRAAQRHGSRRVLYGMSANLHKSRFGAVREKRWAYVQATDTYHADVLSMLAETVSAR